MSACSNLGHLYCHDNLLTVLNVNANAALNTLDCSNNKLINLDLNPQLRRLYCHSNLLTSLDVSKNTLLKTLNCSENQFTNGIITRHSHDVSANIKQ